MLGKARIQGKATNEKHYINIFITFSYKDFGHFILLVKIIIINKQHSPLLSPLSVIRNRDVTRFERYKSITSTFSRYYRIIQDKMDLPDYEQIYRINEICLRNSDKSGAFAPLGLNQQPTYHWKNDRKCLIQYTLQ